MVGELLMAGLGVAAFGAVASDAWRRRVKRCERLSQPWRALAKSRGLRFDMTQGITHHSFALSGSLERRPVQLEFAVKGEGFRGNAGHGNGKHRTTASAPVRVDLPLGLELRHETGATEAMRYFGAEDMRVGHSRLDDTLRVRCEDEASLRALFTHEAVREAFFQHFCPRPGSELTGRELILTNDLQDAGPGKVMLDGAIALAEAIEDSVADTLRPLVRPHRLTLADTAKDGRWTAEGSVEGLLVRVSAGYQHTDVAVELPTGAPAGLTIRTKEDPEPREGASVQLANPLLGRLLDVQADDPELAASHLHDALTEPLLAALKGHPGSAVAAGQVVIALGPLHEARVGDAIDEAVALAIALGAPPLEA
jgi:hypothetical protein